VAIGLRDGSIHVRRVADGGRIAVLNGPAPPVCDVVFGPEGRTLMALHTGGTIQLCTPDPKPGWVCSRVIKGEEAAPPLAAPEQRQFVGFARYAYDLRLMSSGDALGGIPTAGKSLAIVATMKHSLHFRIFDGKGQMVVDTDETKLTTQARPIE